MAAPVVDLMMPDTDAVGVGVNVTSWALVPAARLTLSDFGSKPGALVVIVALPTGRFSSSNRPSAPVVAVAVPIFTDAPSMTAPEAAATTPDTVAVAVGVGPPRSLSPQAGRIDVAKAAIVKTTPIERFMELSFRSVNARRFVLRQGVDTDVLHQPVMSGEQGLLIEAVSRVIPENRPGLRDGCVQCLCIGRRYQVVLPSVLHQQRRGRVRYESNRLYGCHGAEPGE